jgi:hypothetical protein
MKLSNNKLKFLFNYLKSVGLKKEASLIKGIIKTSYLDYPIEETDIDSKDDLFLYLEENPGELIFLDNPAGTHKKFGNNDKRLPFHYGEFPGLINPADDMGWDIVIVPSYNDAIVDGDLGHVDSGHNLEPIGYVPVNESKEDWANNASKDPPIGNDKIILAPEKKYSESDINSIVDFFSDLWQFNKVRLF